MTTVNITIYACTKCGWIYMFLTDNLVYGPLWETPTAHLMTSGEFFEEYGDCAVRLDCYATSVIREGRIALCWRILAAQNYGK